VQEKLAHTKSLKLVGVAVSECLIARQISLVQEVEVDMQSLVPLGVGTEAIESPLGKPSSYWLLDVKSAKNSWKTTTAH
jgi:hypothetical protein